MVSPDYLIEINAIAVILQARIKSQITWSQEQSCEPSPLKNTL